VKERLNGIWPIAEGERQKQIEAMCAIGKPTKLNIRPKCKWQMMANKWRIILGQLCQEDFMDYLVIRMDGWMDFALKALWVKKTSLSLLRLASPL
jgi:hypothetical protein